MLEFVVEVVKMIDKPKSDPITGGGYEIQLPTK